MKMAGRAIYFSDDKNMFDFFYLGAHMILCKSNWRHILPLDLNPPHPMNVCVSSA
jgi:hypothetical protein